MDYYQPTTTELLQIIPDSGCTWWGSSRIKSSECPRNKYNRKMLKKLQLHYI